MNQGFILLSKKMYCKIKVRFHVCADSLSHEFDEGFSLGGACMKPPENMTG